MQTSPLLERALKVLENATFSYRINQRWLLRSTPTLPTLVTLVAMRSAGLWAARPHGRPHTISIAAHISRSGCTPPPLAMALVRQIPWQCTARCVCW